MIDKVYISGLHSNTNPLPGIGVARSLRDELPNLKLIGVDYSPDSTGLAWSGFDEVLVRPAWSEKSQFLHSHFVTEVVSCGAYWLSCLDLEIHLLARAPTVFGVLSPQDTASLAITAKPCDQAAKLLGLARPRTCRVKSGAQEAFNFLCATGWQAWLKPSHYGAFPVRSWAEYAQSLEMLRSIWGGCEAFIEEHVAGRFESIAFASFNGKYLGGVAMHKGETTAEGKTWTGRVEPISKSTEKVIAAFCKTLGWTGGAELECIRHPSGRLYLLEVNPRFPAWIYGASMAGTNLPARLVEAATGKVMIDSSSSVQGIDEFVRLVMEYPKRKVEHYESSYSSEVHPSGMPLLSKASLNQCDDLDFNLLSGSEGGDSKVMTGALSRHMASKPEFITPFFLLDESGVRQRFREFNDSLEGVAGLDFKVEFAYSCKTNPDLRVLRLAESENWLVDAISMLEVDKCVTAGFDTTRIILNGPAKLWPDSHFNKYLGREFFAINCDSFSELDRVLGLLEDESISANFVGIRLRPAQIRSRFGAAIGDSDQYMNFFHKMEKISKYAKPCLHMHLPAQRLGEQWLPQMELLSAFVAEFNTNFPAGLAKMIDFGGGWNWDQFMGGGLRGRLLDICERMSKYGVKSYVFEPGKSVVQAKCWYVSQVLDVREAYGQFEVVVDGSITGLGDYASHPRSFFFLRKSIEGHVYPLEYGKVVIGAILGRTCMESDVFLQACPIPEDLKVGDYFVVSDCGAYDFSMGYGFGTGVEQS